MLRYWVDLNPSEFEGFSADDTVAILPVGATEQHGPHLPLGVDGMIGDGIVRRAAAHSAFDGPVLVLPTVWVGRSEEHSRYPGSLTLSAETLRRTWFETGQSVARAGVRKLIIFNSHGGQIQVMQIVARELRIAHSMFVVGVSWVQLGLPDIDISASERQFGIHAGQLETSMMLALRPDLTDMTKAENFIPQNQTDAARFPLIRSLGAAGYGWQVQDLHPAGACGNARAGSAAEGEKLLDHAAQKLCSLIDEVADYPLENINDAI